MNIKIIICLIFSVFLSISTYANIGGSDLQNFNPTPSGTGFITVHDTQILNYGQFNFGSFLTYATNSLPYSTLSANPNNQKFSEPNDRILQSNLHVAIGLLQGWDIGVSAGFTNSQDIDRSNFLFNYGDTGINDVLIRSKVRIYKDRSFALAIVGGVDFDQIKNNPFLGDNAGPAAQLEGVLDFYLTPDIHMAINGGYRLRNEGTPIPNTGVTPMPDQWVYSSAISYTTDDNGSAAIFEIYGSYPIEVFSLPTDRQISNLETLVGYKWAGLNNLDIHGGFGTEAYHGLGSPDIRIYLGFNWKLGNNENKAPDTIIPEQSSENIQDNDGDLVPNPIDQCPNTPSNLDVDERGCHANDLPQKEPTTPTSSLDEDGDGVSDNNDRCLNTSPGARVNHYGCEIDPYDQDL
mgnify:CR=1 FL=1